MEKEKKDKKLDAKDSKVPIEIRSMATSDLGQVLAIERASFVEPWSRRIFVTGLRDKASIYLVASMRGAAQRARLPARGLASSRRLCPAGQLVGYVGLLSIFEEGHITNLAVHHDHRRRKIGSRLLLAIVREALARKIRWLTLEVREKNLAAQRLYQKFGFKQEGLGKGYYSEAKEDALIFWTDDITSRNYQKLMERIVKDLDE